MTQYKVTTVIHFDYLDVMNDTFKRGSKRTVRLVTAHCVSCALEIAVDEDFQAIRMDHPENSIRDMDVVEVEVCLPSPDGEPVGRNNNN